jgi:hypothetical protein
MSKIVTRCQKKSTGMGFPFDYERIKRNPGVFKMSFKRLALRKQKRVVVKRSEVICTFWLHLWGTQIDF